MAASADLVIFWTALILGLRHGLDTDHLAALADIAGTQSTKRSSTLGCIGYALGHAAIVLVIGAVALFLGMQIPQSWSGILEKIVGATLLILAGAIIFSAFKFKQTGRLMSRWRILHAVWHRIMHPFGTKDHDHTKPGDDLSFGGCFVIGILHGVGVESPTQIFAIGAALTMGSSLLGMGLLSMFVIGMIVSFMGVAMLAIYGFQTARQRNLIFLVLSLLSAAFSIYIGLHLILN